MTLRRNVNAMETGRFEFVNVTRVFNMVVTLTTKILNYWFSRKFENMLCCTNMCNHEFLHQHLKSDIKLQNNSIFVSSTS